VHVGQEGGLTDSAKDIPSEGAGAVRVSVAVNDCPPFTTVFPAGLGAGTVVSAPSVGGRRVKVAVLEMKGPYEATT
jgi:hypothetical protein